MSNDPYGTMVFNNAEEFPVGKSGFSYITEVKKPNHGSVITNNISQRDSQGSILFSKAHAFSLISEAGETLDSTLSKPPSVQNFEGAETGNIVCAIWNRIGALTVQMIGQNASEVDWSDDLTFEVISKGDGFIYQGQTRNGRK